MILKLKQEKNVESEIKIHWNIKGDYILNLRHGYDINEATQ